MGLILDNNESALLVDSNDINSTPPAGKLSLYGKVAESNTVALLHFNEATQAEWSDVVGGTVSFLGGAVSTNYIAFLLGARHALFASTGNYIRDTFSLSGPQIADDGPWTIEYLYSTSLAGPPNVASFSLQNISAINRVQVTDNLDGTLDVVLNAGGETINFTGLPHVTAAGNGSQRYIVVQFDGGTTVRCWVNATEATESPYTIVGPILGGIDRFSLDCTSGGANNAGYDEIRVSNVDRYTATPPATTLSTEWTTATTGFYIKDPLGVETQLTGDPAITAEEIVFGAGTTVDSSPNLTFDPTTGKFWLNTLDGNTNSPVFFPQNVALLTYGPTTNGSAADILLQTGNGNTSGTGGDISLLAGEGGTSGSGGTVIITAGAGGDTGTGGGDISIAAGAGGGTSGDGGNVSILAGSPTDGTGGSVTIEAASGGGTNGAGGNTDLVAGNSNGTANGGQLTLAGGNAGGSGDGGNVTVIAGATDTGTGGTVYLTPGDNGTSGEFGDVVAGQTSTGSTSTTRTGNFLFIPTSAGPPTGVPAGGGAGLVAIVFDTVNNELYIYNGGWVSIALA